MQRRVRPPLSPDPTEHDRVGPLGRVRGGCRELVAAVKDDSPLRGVRPPGVDHPQDERAEAVDDAVKQLPKPADLLVNNAGITRDRTIVNMSDEEWQSVIDVNLTGAFHCIRAVAPAMRTNRYGRIVNIASINGLRGKFGQANYSASKAGLIALTKTAARELGRDGITVNAVAPGMVLTEMTMTLDESIRAKAQQEALLVALPESSDVTAAVLFLLSDAARAITGQVLQVDAGQYL